jgi:lysophospholipase L1-like esterase
MTHAVAEATAGARRPRPLWIRAAGYVAYLAVASAVLLLLLEGAGRLYVHFRYGRPDKTYGLWIADPELGATHRPHGYNTHTSLNAYGLRNQEEVFDPKPPGSLRILCLGGSTTYGYNLADGETYTERLEARLRRRPGWERSQVLNAGRITYSAAQNLILARRLVPALKPDYVLLYEGVNELFNEWMLLADGRNLDPMGDTYGVIGKSYDYNRWLLRNSLLMRFIDYVVKNQMMAGHGEAEGSAPKPPSTTSRPSSTAPEPIHPWLVRNYDHLLRQMIGDLRSQGTTPIVFRYPSVRSSAQRFFSDMSARVAAEEGVTVCDLASRFEAFGTHEADYFIDTGVHVTPQGAEILAEEVEKTIVSLEAQRRSPVVAAGP